MPVSDNHILDQSLIISLAFCPCSFWASQPQDEFISSSEIRGNMDMRLGFLLLLVFGVLGTSSARQLPRNLEAKYPEQESLDIVRKDMACALCKEYAAMVLDYLGENKTQEEIIALLHISCFQLGPLESECVYLVDHYVPLFLSEISSIKPKKFCKEVGLCKGATIASPQIEEDGCGFCRNAVPELMDRLKDPDTQMDIVLLLKEACDTVEKYPKKCKRMVFEYGPLLIASAEQYQENTDVCAAVHACPASATVEEDRFPTAEEVTVLSDS